MGKAPLPDQTARPPFFCSELQAQLAARGAAEREITELKADAGANAAAQRHITELRTQLEAKGLTEREVIADLQVSAM